MATTAEPVELHFPKLPAKHEQFLQYVAAHPQKPMLELLEPFKQYDAELRKAFAQQPDHPAVKQPSILPVFAGHEKHVTVRARDPKAETEQQRDCYIMPLQKEDRKPNGAPAIVQSMKEFQTNFAVFSESSLADLDWSNIAVCGSAVVTSLLSVPKEHAKSKRALRQYYHEHLAPASDVDIFLYGLTEEQAMEKIKQIERNVRDALLVETTTVRTKNAITIASKHPVRHVQIVLRIYKNISEILTGFDVDCSCAAYDGKQVYVSPRALVSYMTQINTIDLTRRSPSYENRLSKYAHRGFEAYWPNLDRSRIDPTIFERSFGRTEGLARLLILEKLPRSEDRDSYLDQRRAERGRPSLNRHRFRSHVLYGNIKDEHEDEVAEWVGEDVSDYHTVTVPYGEKFHARKIEKLLFTKDMLLNAEWNKPKDREVNLHRHPAFFGSVDDVVGDCCGFCPEPSTVEEEEVAEEESKKFIKGPLTFMKDDPGRQAIGSFNPIDAEGWTEMAYVGNTARLCQAIVDEDVEYVKSWLEQEGNDPNTRDYTGRTPLHLAVTNSTPEVVQALIDHGARMVARLVDGRTALHLAAMRGSVEMVSALLRKSAANEEENEEKTDARRAERKAAKESQGFDVAMGDAEGKPDASAGGGKGGQAEEEEDSNEDSDVDMVDGSDDEANMNDATTEGSMVDIRKLKIQDPEDALLAAEDEDEPDVFDVNVVAWDTAVSPLHLAIVQGHVEVVKCLVQEFGADVLLPIKIFNDHDKSARAAILTLVLAMQLGFEKAQEMVKTLISLGASSAQADMDRKTVLQFAVADRPEMLDTLGHLDATGVKRAINHVAASGWRYRPDITSPLIIAIQAKDSATAVRLLAGGAKAEIDFPTYIKALKQFCKIDEKDSKRNKEDFQERFEQPIFDALKGDLPQLVKSMVTDHGANVDVLATEGWEVLNNEYRRSSTRGRTLLDAVRERSESLKQWKFKSKAPKPPIPMKQSDAEYLAEYKEGTYAYYTAKRKVESGRASYQADLERYEEDVKEKEKDKQNAEAKREAINGLISEFEDLEKTLLDKGAKSFYELHPEVEEPRDDSPRRRRSHNYDIEPVEFAVYIDFQLGDLTNETREMYLRLFEAAWSGDLATVKDLTLNTWQNEDGEEQPPLQIAVQDDHSLSPFAIAVLQGHQDLATAAMEIAQAQRIMPDPDKQRKYGIEDDEDSDEDSDDSDGEVQLYSEIVDDEFTKEDIGEVNLQVKSKVAPLAMLEWDCNYMDWAKDPAPDPEKKKESNGFSYFGPRKPHKLANKRTNTGSIKLPPDTISGNYEEKTTGCPESLFQLAMRNNDPALLAYLLKLGHEYNQKDTKISDEHRSTFFELAEDDYQYALEVGRSHIFMELVKQTGAGIPLTELVEKYGIELKEKAKYYQGLTVHGTKRKDWASRDGEVAPTPTQQTPPLLDTINKGSLELVEWWLSDAPIRCYKEFAEANREDKRIYRLTQSKIGFEGAAQKFLATRSHLAIHCAVMAPASTESMKLLRYVIEVMPESLEAKNRDKVTPLQVAFATYHKGAAKLLIEAGADQMCRDTSLRNLVHTLVDRNPCDDDEKFAAWKEMLALIDKRLIQEMFFQRSNGETPLAQWIASTHAHEDHRDEALKTILSYSGGKDLRLINGQGDTPLHSAVKDDDKLLVKMLLEHDPTLLNRENATGRTPFEMAEDAIIAGKCTEPPPMPRDYDFGGRRAIRYGLPRHWHTEILSRWDGAFVPDKQEPEVSTKHEVWAILQECRAKLEAEGGAKRRLVTLNEANEVARRLASMKRRGGASDDVSEATSTAQDETVGQDEVQQWMNCRSYHGIG